MGKIKSAWEIALERTESIVVDKNKIALDEEIKRVRQIAGSFLNDEECDLNALINKLDRVEDKKALKEGIKLTVITNLTLPNEAVTSDRYERIYALIDYSSNSDANTLELASQIIGFCKQYPDHKEQLLGQLKEQFAPMAEQKAASIRSQYGADIPFSLEQDPEFIKLAQAQLERLQREYNNTLMDAKEKLKERLN